MGRIETFPSITPMPAVARILARYDRAKLEAFLSVAIDLLDTLDGEPDIECDDPPEDSDVSEDDDPAEDDDPREIDDVREHTLQPTTLNSI